MSSSVLSNLSSKLQKKELSKEQFVSELLASKYLDSLFKEQDWGRKPSYKKLFRQQFQSILPALVHIYNENEIEESIDGLANQMVDDFDGCYGYDNKPADHDDLIENIADNWDSFEYLNNLASQILNQEEFDVENVEEWLDNYYHKIDFQEVRSLFQAFWADLKGKFTNETQYALLSVLDVGMCKICQDVRKEKEQNKNKNNRVKALQMLTALGKESDSKLVDELTGYLSTHKETEALYYALHYPVGILTFIYAKKWVSKNFPHAGEYHYLRYVRMATAITMFIDGSCYELSPFVKWLCNYLFEFNQDSSAVYEELEKQISKYNNLEYADKISFLRSDFFDGKGILGNGSFGVFVRILRANPWIKSQEIQSFSKLLIEKNAKTIAQVQATFKEYREEMLKNTLSNLCEDILGRDINSEELARLEAYSKDNDQNLILNAWLHVFHGKDWQNYPGFNGMIDKMVKWELISDYNKNDYKEIICFAEILHWVAQCLETSWGNDWAWIIASSIFVNYDNYPIQHELFSEVVKMDGKNFGEKRMNLLKYLQDLPDSTEIEGHLALNSVLNEKSLVDVSAEDYQKIWKRAYEENEYPEEWSAKTLKKIVEKFKKGELKEDLEENENDDEEDEDEDWEEEDDEEDDDYCDNEECEDCQPAHEKSQQKELSKQIRELKQELAELKSQIGKKEFQSTKADLKKINSEENTRSKFAANLQSNAHSALYRAAARQAPKLFQSLLEAIAPTSGIPAEEIPAIRAFLSTSFGSTLFLGLLGYGLPQLSDDQRLARLSSEMRIEAYAGSLDKFFSAMMQMIRENKQEIQPLMEVVNRLPKENIEQERELVMVSIQNSV